MARGKTFKFGKTLVNISGRGIATKDTTTGEIKRHAFPWTQPRPTQPEPVRPEDEDDSSYEAEEPQGGYYGEPEDGYPEDEAGYDGEEQEYGEDDEDESRPAGVLAAPWFMWLMLVLLPPLGIWLLWRHNRYELTVRSAISAAAVVWFIVMLIWLFSHIGGSDQTVANLPTATPSAAPQAVSTESATPVTTPDGGDKSVGGNDGTGVAANPGASAGAATDTPEPGVSPSPTPNTSGIDVTPDPGASASPGATDGLNPTQVQYVWSTQDGKNYHSNATCSNMTNASRVTLSVALTRGQTACPICWTQPSNTPKPTGTALPADSFYATPTGTYYHSDPTCTGMKSAQVVTRSEAIGRGQTACPKCVGSVYMTDGGTYYHANSTCTGMKNARLVTVDEATAAGKTACPRCMTETGTTNLPGTNGNTGNTGATNTGETVYWCTAGGKYYHANSTCTGMVNAYRTSAAAAENNGKTPCPTCLRGNSGNKTYYATATGSHYHTNATCSGMKNATRVSLATALSRGQTACPVCAGGVQVTEVKTTVTNTTAPNVKTGSTTYYSTADGQYFHVNQTCQGMKGATAVSAAEIAARGQTPCPRCIGTSGTYYSTSTGAYYHSNPTCTGMKGADIVTLAMIRARGQSACPKCIGTTTGDTTGDYYYATAGGEHYHKNATCSGMKNAVRVTRAVAESRGQTPCPTCIGSVYSAGGQYYHKDPNCQGMKNAQLVTILAAEKAGQTPCPRCIGGGATPEPTDAPDNVDSNLIYYATAVGEHYHRTATCSGMKGAAKVSEATAKARGQTPCPICIGTVYATENGDYYHSNPTCTGMKNAHLTTVDQAELSGKAPCPVCMGGTPIEAPGDTGGTVPVDPTKVEVWVTIEGSKYHSQQYCSGMKNAAKTSLSWALSHNYERCTVCDAPSA